MAPSPEAPPPPSRRHRRCERCVAWVLPIAPHWGWRAAEVTVWIGIPALLFFAAKGPGLILLPIVCMMAAGLFGPLRERAHATARCPGCARYLAEG